MYAKNVMALQTLVPWFNQINEATQTNVDMNNKGI